MSEGAAESDGADVERVPAVPPEQMRVSDAERGVAERRLHRANEVGQLDISEFDTRVSAVWAARTRGELTRLTADLPEVPDPPAAAPARAAHRRRGPVFSDTDGGTAMRVLTTIWLSLTAVNLTVWGLVVLTTGHLVYPWWVWVAGPPGAVLLALYVVGIGRPRTED